MRLRNPWRGLEGLPREVWTLCLATFINRSGTMVLPFLVLYLTESLGFSARRAGVALLVYGIGSFLVQPVAGHLTDRLGAPRILRASLFLSAVFLVVLANLRRYEALLLGILVWAVVNEAFRPASLALVGELVRPEKRKSAFALNRLAVNLGMSFGPAIGGFLAMHSFRWLFLVDAATAFAAWWVLLLAPWRTTRPEPDTTLPGAGEPAPTGGRRTVFGDRRLLYFVVALFPVCLVFFQHLGAMPLYLVRDLRQPASFFGLLGTLNTGIILLVEVPLNHAMAHWPHRRALALGALLSGAGFGALGIAHGAWAIAATVVVWTFGEMILFPGSAAYVAEIAPAARRGEYMGAYSMTFSAALILGPWLGTAVLDACGASVLWAAVFACGCVSVLLLRRLRS